MQEKTTLKLTLQRNYNHNFFLIKIPSHNASRELVQNMSLAHILNKLSLVPLHEDQKTIQLYKQSLQILLQISKEHFQDQQFVDDLTDHLTNWEIRMREFGSWLFTRAAFFSIQQKVKKNRALWENVVLKRALLQPNKQQFLNRCMTQTFQNPQLLSLIDNYQGLQAEISQKQHFCHLPNDILYEDSDVCWQNLEQKYSEIDQNILKEYMEEYLQKGLSKYICKMKNTTSLKSIDIVQGGLNLRKKIMELTISPKMQYFNKIITQLSNSEENNQVYQ